MIGLSVSSLLPFVLMYGIPLAIFWGREYLLHARALREAEEYKRASRASWKGKL